MLNILNLHSAVGQLHLKKARQESMYLFKNQYRNNFFLHIYMKKARERQNKQHFDYKRKIKNEETIILNYLHPLISFPKSFPNLKVNKKWIKIHMFIKYEVIRWFTHYPVYFNILWYLKYLVGLPQGKNMPTFLVILCSAVRASVWKTIQITFFTISKYSQEIQGFIS